MPNSPEKNCATPSNDSYLTYRINKEILIADFDTETESDVRSSPFAHLVIVVVQQPSR